jgi:hypothetical protein
LQRGDDKLIGSKPAGVLPAGKVDEVGHRKRAVHDGLTVPKRRSARFF